jgi:hypothetical protein
MMAYMKWVSMIRDAVVEQHERGMLGVLAAKTNIQEYRLRDWATKRTIDDLGYSELAKLHDAMSEHVISESQNVVTESEEQRAEAIAASARRSAGSNCEECKLSFDESD